MIKLGNYPKAENPPGSQSRPPSDPSGGGQRPRNTLIPFMYHHLPFPIFH